MKMIRCISLVLLIISQLSLNGQYNFSQEFDIDQPAAMKFISLDEIAGIIEIFPSDNNGKVRVEMVMMSKSHIGTPERNYDGNFGVSVRSSGNQVEIRGTSDDDNRRYQIWIPAGLPIMGNLNQNRDEIIVHDWTAPVELSGRGINITFKNASGPFTINATHGDIDIELADHISDTPSSIITGAGEIKLSFSGDAKATLRMRTGQGSIMPTIPIQFSYNLSTQKWKEAIARVNGGGTEFYLETTQGDIVISEKKRG